MKPFSVWNMWNLLFQKWNTGYLKKCEADCLNLFFKVSEVLFETTEIVFWNDFFFK